VTIVVDTSILIDHLRGDSRAHVLLRNAFQSERRRVVASVMTKVEVVAGIRSSEEEATQRLLELFEWIPVDEAIADRAGQLGRRFLRSHPGVDPVDFVIAATVEQLDAELWTRNLKHFPMFEELLDPYDA
jgi:predicted nucleic acid-binding protein